MAAAHGYRQDHVTDATRYIRHRGEHFDASVVRFLVLDSCEQRRVIYICTILFKSTNYRYHNFIRTRNVLARV